MSIREMCEEYIFPAKNVFDYRAQQLENDPFVKKVEFAEKVEAGTEIYCNAMNYGRPIVTRATQFICLDRWPIINVSGYIQIKINTSHYFSNLDGSINPGRHVDSFKQGAKMYIGVYILPGQSFEIIFTPDEDVDMDKGISINLPYILYDGMDATICNKLLCRGIQISPENVDDYKKEIKDKGDKAMQEVIDPRRSPENVDDHKKEIKDKGDKAMQEVIDPRRNKS